MKNFLPLLLGLLLALGSFAQNDSSLTVNTAGQILDSSILNQDDGAISFFFKADPSDFVAGQTKTILSVEDASGDNVLAIRIGETTSNIPNWGNGITVAGKRSYTDTTLYRFKWTQTPASSLYDNNWHHVLISFDSGSISFGLDGVYEPSNGENMMLPFGYPSDIFVEGNTFTSNTTECSLGDVDGFLDFNGNNASDGAFVGLIDDLAFYDTPISTTNYEANFDGDKFCYTTGQLVIFEFNDATFTDLSGYAATDLSDDVPYVIDCDGLGAIAPPEPAIPNLLLSPNPAVESIVAESVQGLVAYKVYSASGVPMDVAMINEEPLTLDVSELPRKQKYVLKVKDDFGIRKSVFIKM